jgi:hypothetical protein
MDVFRLPAVVLLSSCDVSLFFFERHRKFSFDRPKITCVKLNLHKSRGYATKTIPHNEWQKDGIVHV